MEHIKSELSQSKKNSKWNKTKQNPHSHTQRTQWWLHRVEGVWKGAGIK